MKCNHCGHLIDDDSSFCPVCGKKLDLNENMKNLDESSKEEIEIEKNIEKSEKAEKNKVVHYQIFLYKLEQLKKRAKAYGARKFGKSKKKEDSSSVKEDEKIDNSSSKKEDEVHEAASVDEDINFDTADRYSKQSRLYGNLGRKKSLANQRSVIEEIQGKILLNEENRKAEDNSKEDYYIEDEPGLGLEKSSDKLDKLLGAIKKRQENPTISSAIRDFQERNKRIERINSLEKYRDKLSSDESDSQFISNKVLTDENKKATKESDSPKPKTADKKPKEKFDFKSLLTSKNLIIALIGLLIILLLAIFFLKKTKVEDVNINLSDYIDVSFEGEDGSATPKAVINKDKIISDFADKVVYTSRNKNKDSFSSAADEMASDIETNIVFQYSKDQNLSNGDEITVMANMDNFNLHDKYNVTIANASKSVIVDGILNSNATDPFQYIKVEFEGTSPNMSIKTTLADDAPEFMNAVEIIPSKSKDIKDGEEISVSLHFNADELMANYNVNLSPTSKNFTATSSSTEDDSTDSEYIKSTANLNQELLGEMKYKAGELIKQTIIYKNIINVDNINYLGAFTGYNKDEQSDIKNRVFLVYEVETSEKLLDNPYKGNFKYYTFVEYQNVKKEKPADGNAYSQGPLTTDNQIFHKFFVESEYKYYQIEYQGFGFVDDVLQTISQALQDLSVKDDMKVNIKDYFTIGDGVAGEYKADNQRLSLKADGSLTYQIDKAVHMGTYTADSNKISATIHGVNIDTPITMTYDSGNIKVEDQAEMKATTFTKIQNY